MSDQVCKCCGQTRPPIEGLNIPMPEGLKKIVETVRKAGKHGISTDRLFDKIYGGDIDGGPASGTKVLHVRICAANKILRQHNWRLKGEYTGTRYTYGRYTLRRIEEVRDATNR